MLIAIHNLMWENLWLMVSMNFSNLLKRRKSMKFNVFTEGGREFTVKAEDVESAELVAKTCLKKGEIIDGIEKVEEEKKVEERKEDEKEQGKEVETGEEAPGEEEEKKEEAA